MRTMKQVWMIVALPFLGLVIISSMVIGLLGWGNYRYDTNPANLFTKSACTIIDGSVQEFSQFKSPYSSSCLPAMITCYEVIWQVTYDNNQSSGKVFSNGVSSVVATSLMDQYVINNTYTCWYLRNEVISWQDWSPTEQDKQHDVRLMIIGVAIVGSFLVILLILGICYVHIGKEQWPFIYDTPIRGYETLQS